MIDDLDTLPNDPALLKQIIARQQGRLMFLEEQFRLAQHRQFAASSEAYPGQGELFNEAESIVEPVEDESAEIESVVTQPHKPVRKRLPKELPREQVVLDLDDANKVCDGCQQPLTQIGESRSEKLFFIPAQVKVIETIRPKYACRPCEQAAEPLIVKQAPVPPSILPKGIATPSLLSQIITSKYQYGLPLYRQEALFEQYGITLSRKTMADWMIHCAGQLAGLYERMHHTLLQQPVIHADETTLKVVNEDKNTCYMWLYCCGADSPNGSNPLPNIVLYDFQRSRAGQCAMGFLDGYQGYLQVDGYAGYAQTEATLCGCWAHARRKFMEVKQSQPKGRSGKADMALAYIQKLYRIETAHRDATIEVRYNARLQQAKPQLERFRQWLDKTSATTPPKSALARAINYCLNQWEKLSVYLEDGLLSIDNNRAERAIKPFVIGRKNWLFSNTARGAQASATLYSLIETAKANGLVPFDYLTHLFTELPLCKDEENLEKLLPWNLKQR